MAGIVLSLIPVFALIALGVFLRRLELLAREGWAALERLTYYVLFPPVLFMSVAGGSFGGGEALRLGVALGGAVIGLSALMILTRALLPISGAQFSSVFQAGIRWNSYVALGVISGLHGKEGVALSAVAFAVMVPLNNLFSVLVLSRYASHKPAPMSRVVRTVATNPLIIATLLGGLVAASGVQIPKPAADTLNLLAQATVSIGLLCVGAALDFGSMGSARVALAAGALFRVLVMPAIALGLCLALGVGPLGLSIAMICVSAPVATSAYILARQLGGDATLMANLTTLTTLLSLVLMPAAILVANTVR